VVTVGFSPSASALSALTIAARRLVLVHTTASKEEAARIKRLLCSLADPPQVELLHCGDATTFPATWHALTAELARLGIEAPYRLDYTGGPKVLTVCAVRRHIADHGDAGDVLRSWVDDVNGTLSIDAATGPAPVLDTAELTIVRIAALHGFALHGWRVPHPHPVTIDRSSLRELLTAPAGTAAEQVRDRLVKALDAQKIGRPQPSWVTGSDSGDPVGAAAEAVATAIATARGDLDEIVISGLAGRAQEPAGQFDLLLRRRHRVVAVEVKGSAGSARGSALGMHVTRSRVVFGPAARALLVVRRGGEDIKNWNIVLAEADGLGETLLTDQLGMIGMEAANLTGGWDLLDSMLGLKSKSVGFRHGRAVAPIRRPDRGPADVDLAVVPAYGDMVVPVSGSALGVVSAARAAPAARVRLLGPAALRAKLHRLNPVDLPADQDLPVLDTVTAVLDVLSDLDVGGCGLAVGPSHKRTTATFVKAAARDGHDLVHVSVSGRVQSWNRGRWMAPHPVDWAEHLADIMMPGPWVATRAPAGHDLGRLRLAYACLAGGDAAWLVGRDPRLVWTPPLLYLGGHRCLAVLAPKNLKDDGRAMAMAVETFLARRVGDAAGVLLVIPAELDAPQRAAWEQRAANRRWDLAVDVGCRLQPVRAADPGARSRP
jgi:hypothetical protein